MDLESARPSGFVEIRRRGLMLVLSSPSGAGKTTISRRLLGLEPGLALSISATTRPMRPGERNAVDYHFARLLALVVGPVLPIGVAIRRGLGDACIDGRDLCLQGVDGGVEERFLLGIRLGAPGGLGSLLRQGRRRPGKGADQDQQPQN